MILFLIIFQVISAILLVGIILLQHGKGADIGSGIAVQNEHLEEVSLLIKDLVRDNLGTDLTLIYGGSVTSESAKNLAKVDGIDGFLVGNASLDPKEFANIALSLE